MAELEEVYRAAQASQERYAYFFLAAAGSAIGFAVVRTEDTAAHGWMVPVGVAVALWGASFYSGCQHLLYRGSNLRANVALLEIRQGRDPEVGTDPRMIEAAASGVMEAVDKNAKNQHAYGRGQYYLFLAGAGCYLLGHVWRIFS